MSRPRKPKDFWDDGETTPEDIKRGTANRQQVFKELIQHAVSTEPLDGSRVAQWHNDCLSGLSYVTDESLLGTYRGTNHPRLKNMQLKIATPVHLPARFRPLVVFNGSFLETRRAGIGKRDRRRTRNRAGRRPGPPGCLSSGARKRVGFSYTLPECI